MHRVWVGHHATIRESHLDRRQVSVNPVGSEAKVVNHCATGLFENRVGIDDFEKAGMFRKGKEKIGQPSGRKDVRVEHYRFRCR